MRRSIIVMAALLIGEATDNENTRIDYVNKRLGMQFIITATVGHDAAPLK